MFAPRKDSNIYKPLVSQESVASGLPFCIIIQLVM